MLGLLWQNDLFFLAGFFFLSLTLAPGSVKQVYLYSATTYTVLYKELKAIKMKVKLMIKNNN